MVWHRSFEQTSNGKRDFPPSRHVQINISAPFCYRMRSRKRKSKFTSTMEECVMRTLPYRIHPKGIPEGKSDWPLTQVSSNLQSLRGGRRRTLLQWLSQATKFLKSARHPQGLSHRPVVLKFSTACDVGTCRV